MNWYVVQVVSGQEKKAKTAIEDNRVKKGMEDLIAEVLVPTENVAEVKGEKQTVHLIQKPSYEGLSELIGNIYQFDFIYVDGDHRPHMALSDGCMAWGLLKQGGTMLFDDYLYPEKPTKDGIDAFLKGYEGLYEIIVNNYQLGIKKL